MELNKIDLAAQFDEIVADEKRQLRKTLNKGIGKAADKLIDYFKTSPKTPDDPTDKNKNKYRESFGKKVYNGVQYVGNTKTVSGAKSDTIPLSNILESEDKTKHMRQIFEEHEDELADIVTDEFSNF